MNSCQKSSDIAVALITYVINHFWNWYHKVWLELSLACLWTIFMPYKQSVSILNPEINKDQQ